MATKTIPLWIEPAENRLYRDWQNNNLAETMVFKQGDTVSIDLHLIKKLSGQASIMEEVEFPEGCTIRLAIGTINLPPKAGTYTVSYMGSSASLAFDATASQIQTALNALSSIAAAGGVAVSSFGSTMFQVAFNTNGVRADFSTDSSLLFPTSVAKFTTLKEGTTSVRKICLLKLSQTPCVYQSVWANSPQPAISVTELVSNKSKRVSITPTPKAGTWMAVGTQSVNGTLTLQGLKTPTPTQIANAFSVNHTKVFSIFATEQDFTVQSTVESFTTGVTNDTGSPLYQANVLKSDSFSWDFTLRTDYDAPSGYTFPLTASGGGLIGFKSKTALVSFNTAEVEMLLNGASSATAVLEIEVEDLLGNKWTILQTNCIITNDLIDQENFDVLEYGVSLGDAPSDGNQYVRKDGGWQILSIDGGTY